MRAGSDLDAMIVLYTVEQRTIREIAVQFGLTTWDTREALLEAGVELRLPGKRRLGRVRRSGSRTRPPERDPSTPALDLADANHTHLRAVRSALSGMCFPVLPIQRRAA